MNSYKLILASLIILCVTPIRAAEKLIDIQQEKGEFCLLKPTLDLKNKYCAFFGAFDREKLQGGILYQSVVTVKNLQNKDEKDELKRIKYYDITFHIQYEQSRSPLFNNLHFLREMSKVSLLPQIVNITSGDDFSKRYFYDGECIAASNSMCKTLVVKDVKLVTPYAAKFLIVVNDQRPQFVGQSNNFNNEPVSIKLEFTESVNKQLTTSQRRLMGFRGRQLAASSTVSLGEAQNWEAMPKFMDFSGSSSAPKIVGYVFLGNMVVFGLVALIILGMQLKFFSKQMEQKLTQNDILKKFEKQGSIHLRLNQEVNNKYLQKLLKEREEEKQRLMADSCASKVPLMREESFAVITEEDSEISHYSQDEDGNTVRKMVKKSAANADDIARAMEQLGKTPKHRFRGADLFLNSDGSRKSQTGTHRRRKGKGTIGSLEEKSGESGDTLNDQKLHDKIGKGKFNKDGLQMLETPPDFIDSEGNCLELGKSLHQDSITGLEPKDMNFVRSPLDRQNKSYLNGEMHGKEHFSSRTNLTPGGVRRSGNFKGGLGRDLTPEDRYKLNEDSRNTIHQLDLINHGIYLPQNLDSVDKHAIKRWKKNQKKARKKGQLKNNDSTDLNDLAKIVNLYKIYGNDNIALVNPADNPGILQVRTRSAEKRMINKQMGVYGKNLSNSKNDSAVQIAQPEDNQPYHISSNPDIKVFEPAPRSTSKPLYQAKLKYETVNDYQESGKKPKQKRFKGNTANNSHLLESRKDKAFRGFRNQAPANSGQKQEKKQPASSQIQLKNMNQHQAKASNYSGAENTVERTLNDLANSKFRNTQQDNHAASSSQPYETQDPPTPNQPPLQQFALNTDAKFYVSNSSRNQLVHQNDLYERSLISPTIKPQLDTQQPPQLSLAFAHNIPEGVLEQKRREEYLENGSPRVRPQFIEVDVENKEQLREIADAMLQRKISRKQMQNQILRGSPTNKQSLRASAEKQA